MNLRDRYCLPHPGAIELRAFTHGLMPRTVPERMRQFTEDWCRYGVDAWNRVPNHWLPASGESVGWWTLPEYLGDRFIAPLIGASEGTCIWQPNVHWTMQGILSARELFQGKRKVLVLTEAEFPSVRHAAHQWRDLRGIDIRCVPVDARGWVRPEAVLEAIDDRTQMVALSHVGFLSGELLTDDFLRAVSEKTHRHGGYLLVDGYHAVGTLPVEVERLGIDIYTGGLLKAASGSAGSAFIYIRPGLKLTPRVMGWFGEAHPFAFPSHPEPHPEVRRRFLGGTIPVAALYHAVEGARILLEAGLSAVRADVLEKTALCVREARKRNLPLRSPEVPERRSALCILELPHADRMSRYLKQHGIYTDSRQGRYLRMAPFVWNTLDELARTFDVMGQALISGDYLQATEAEGPVT